VGGQTLVLSLVQAEYLHGSPLTLCFSHRCSFSVILPNYETLIQSQHHYNLLVRRRLIRNLVCVILHFFRKDGFICDLNNQDSFLFLSLILQFSQTVSYFFLEDAQKSLKLALFLQSLKEKRWQLSLLSSKIKKNEMNYFQWYFKQNSVLSS